MNVLNAHNAMNASNRIFISSAIGLLCMLLGGSPVSAADSSAIYAATAPALSNVKEMIVQNVRTGGVLAKSKRNCGINSEALTSHLIKLLKNYGLPAFSPVEAKPAQMDVARIEIHPEVVTSNSQDVECTSWVSLSAQTQNALRVPPVETPRSVVVTYWRGGLMVNSLETAHAHVVAEAFEKLVRQLSSQYNRDQPPQIPVFEEKKEEEETFKQ